MSFGNVFDNLSSRPPLRRRPAAVQDEISLYPGLSAAVDKNVSDGIEWWCGKRETYPQLSRMAIDYLAIPGMYLSIVLVLILLILLVVQPLLLT
jgi:hypothetical protein